MAEKAKPNAEKIEEIQRLLKELTTTKSGQESQRISKEIEEKVKRF